MYALIIGCEIAFWIVLGLALLARYVLQRQKLSRALMFALPAVDLLLLALTTADLRSGATATFAHGLAAAYVGFTVAFGSLLVGWADAHFAHRFANGPPPRADIARGWTAVREELSLWGRSIVAWTITILLLSALIAFVDSETVTAELSGWYRIACGSVFLWFVLGPLWRVVFFRRAAASGG